jgi:hypothetical protein
MRKGRFTVTNLNESGKSEYSSEAKKSAAADSSVEIKVAHNRKDSEKMGVVKEPPSVAVKNTPKESSAVISVNFMQYKELISTHEQFLKDYLAKDSQRQEAIQKIIGEILELTEKNAKLEIENMLMKEVLHKNKGNK